MVADTNPMGAVDDLYSNMLADPSKLDLSSFY